MNQQHREKKQRHAELLRQLQSASPFDSVAVQLTEGQVIIINDPFQFVVDAERLYVVLPPAKHVKIVPLSEIQRIGRRRPRISESADPQLSRQI